MYEKNIATAAQSFLNRWTFKQGKKPCATPAKIRQLHRLFKYQLAAGSGKMGGWF